jgi:protein-S-isoprenylcysteine O-methyltransferase Ste14
MNILKTILYMGSLHGFFTFYAPFWLATWSPAPLGLGVLRYSALLFWVLGAWMIIRCSIDVIRQGHGTPAHMDPPKRFLTTGFYRYVRNPIYLGALVILLGHIVWSGSALVVAYFLCYVIAFHILITVFEEPVLRDKFGAAYDEYFKQVPRWIPRWK